MEGGEIYYFVFGIDDDGTVTQIDFLAVNGTVVSSDQDRSGPGWSYAKSTGIITLTADAEVQGVSTNGSFRIVVSETGGTSNLRFKRLNVATAKKDASTVVLERSVTLTLSHTNRVSAAGQYSAGIEVRPDATLTISGGAGGSPADGSLFATGGQNAAGIGSAGGFTAPGKIVIESGTIVAQGGAKAAGIGGGVSSVPVAAS